LQKLVVGVDSSTQSTKVVLCRADDGLIVDQASAPHPDGTECDPRHWWSALGQAGAGLLERAAAIGVAAQQHGMVALDAAGEPVRPALLWNDTRSAAQAAALVGELGGPRGWADRTGSVPVASYTVTKLRWMAEHEPGNAARTAAVLLPHDWLTWRLGAAEHVTDRGDASGTGYWSPVTGDYLPEIVHTALGSPGRDVALPRVAGPREVVGATPAGALLSPGTGDNMGAALGLVLQRGDVVVSLGTSGTAFARNSRASADPTGSVQSFADAEGGFLPLVCTLNAARVLTAGAAMLGTDHAGLDRLALAGAPGAQGLTLVPYLDGERTPNLPAATGSLHGLTRLNATPENLARAVVEGMLLNLAAAVDAVRAVGCPVERVLLIGGAAASTAVQDIAPDLFGVPVAVPSPGEYVAVGAARQAAWALAGGQRPPDWAVDVDVTVDPADVTRGAETRARYDAIVAATHPTAGA
jgi:xylulokinase